MHLFWKKNSTQSEPSSFKLLLSFEERLRKREQLQQRDPSGNFVYVVIEGLNHFKGQTRAFAQIALQKNLTVLCLLEYLRKKVLKVEKDASLYLVVNHRVKEMSATLESIAEKSSDVDGFLYVTVKSEETF